jgi:hypothetical protein
MTAQPLGIPAYFTWWGISNPQCHMQHPIERHEESPLSVADPEQLTSQPGNFPDRLWARILETARDNSDADKVLSTSSSHNDITTCIGPPTCIRKVANSQAHMYEPLQTRPTQ